MTNEHTDHSVNNTTLPNTPIFGLFTDYIDTIDQLRILETPNNNRLELDNDK